MFTTVFRKLEDKENPEEFTGEIIELDKVAKISTNDDVNIEFYMECNLLDKTTTEEAFNKKELTIKFENIEMMEIVELEVFNFENFMYRDYPRICYTISKSYKGNSKKEYYLINNEFYISVENFNMSKASYESGQKEMYAPTIENHNHNSTHHTSETNFIDFGGYDDE